jgi:hypothetical protein
LSVSRATLASISSRSVSYAMGGMVNELLVASW